MKLNKYANIELMNNDLMNFLVNYNLYIQHGNIRKELNVKTPFDVENKWYKTKPDIFKQKP